MKQRKRHFHFRSCVTTPCVSGMGFSPHPLLALVQLLFVATNSVSVLSSPLLSSLIDWLMGRAPDLFFKKKFLFLMTPPKVKLYMRRKEKCTCMEYIS